MQVEFSWKENGQLFNISTKIYAILEKVITEVLYQDLAFEKKSEWNLHEWELPGLLVF